MISGAAIAETMAVLGKARVIDIIREEMGHVTTIARALEKGWEQ